MNDTCTLDADCFIKTSAQCEDETESEYEERTNLITKRETNLIKSEVNLVSSPESSRIKKRESRMIVKNEEFKKRDVSNRTIEAIKQRRDRKKKRIKVGFELNAKLKNRTKSSANLRGFEKLQNVGFMSNTSGVVGIRVDATNIACPQGYVQRKMRCGMYHLFLTC